MSIGWNSTAGRYVDTETGRFISRTDIFDRVDRAVETFKAQGLDYIHGAIIQGTQLSIVESVLFQEIKDAYINAYVSGKGGRDQMTPKDWGIIGRELRNQYGFAREFMQDIASGNLTEAQIANRWGMYYDKAIHAYWRADLETQKGAGKTEMLRTLNSSVPCADCPSYAGHWAEIGTLPLPTEACQCRSRCLCSVVYR